MNPSDVRHGILDQLETAARDSAPRDDVITIHQMDRLVAYSQAISLRRIADALQPTTEQATSPVLSPRRLETESSPETCQHKWQYQGTDGHGSHKGEDLYYCSVCNKMEYR